MTSSKPKVKISNNTFIYPMPMTIVGAIIDDKPNFMPVGWVTRVNANPPMIAIALGKAHYTNKGICENRMFSVNVPSIDLITKTDYCGIVSGKKADKSTIFEVFYGDNKSAPMIKECHISMECKLVEVTELPTNELFIGEIVNAYCDEAVITNGKPDITKLKPFTLTMPDNNYWGIGKQLGQAWRLGKNYHYSDED